MRLSSGSKEIIFLLLLSISSCKDPERPIDDGWSPIENRYASHFRILQRGEDRLLITFGPGGIMDTLDIFLTESDDPPLDRIAVGSTTHLPFIKALGKVDVVKGSAASRSVKDEEFRTAIDAGEIREIGSADGLNKETLVSLSLDVILDHPFGRSLARDISGIPVLHITEYLEEHPLGRAEWVRAFGVLLGEEERADSLFEVMEQRYQDAVFAEDRSDRPRVFFGSNWQGSWFSPPADSYMAILIKDAGGEYVLNDRRAVGNLTLSLEEVYGLLKHCDHFGMILANGGEVDAVHLVGGESRLMELPAVAHGGFYGDTEMVDLFGAALLEPDVVLLDLIAIFHPGKMPGDRQPRYFRPLSGQRTMPR